MVFMSKPRNQARRLGAESKKNKKWNWGGCENRPPYVHYDLAGSHSDAPVRPHHRPNTGYIVETRVSTLVAAVSYLLANGNHNIEPKISCKDYPNDLFSIPVTTDEQTACFGTISPPFSM
jgi:hypothetical protein